MNIDGKYLIKQTLAAPATLVVLSLISCGSSSGPATNSADSPFVNPTDAQSLQVALTTSATLADNTKYWECVLNDGNDTTLRYQLVGGGRGLESNDAAPSMQSSFSWQALSADSISTRTDGESDVRTFTDIQFSGRNNVRMSFAAAGLTLQCARKGEVAAPAAGNSITHEGIVYPLTHAIENKRSFSADRGDTHNAAIFAVADKRYILLPGVGTLPPIPAALGATVDLDAVLFFPGPDDFTSATFEYVPNSTDERGPEVAGKPFFNSADFNVVTGIDGDGEEIITKLDVVGGSITVNRLGSDNARMSFDLLMEDGSTVSGNFQGQFVLVD